MASSQDFVTLVCEQIRECGNVLPKKMFGEYMVYLNGRPIFLICEDILFVKVSEVTTAILGDDTEKGEPYGGAKAHYIVTEIEDGELMTKLASELEKITPLPKPKTKKVRP